MRNEGIGSWTARRARKTPAAVAVVAGDRSWTYAQLHDRVTRLAAGLTGLGIGPGDRVAYLGPNDPTFLETMFATGRIGATFVPLNTRLAAPELAYIISDSGSIALVHGSVDLTSLRDRVGIKHWIGVSSAEPRAAGAEPSLSYETLVRDGEPDTDLDVPVSANDLCMIMYTSGTTGRPKGASLTHGNVTWNSVNVLVDADIRSDEVTLVSAPMFHTAALNMCTMPTILKGGRVVLEPAFDVDRTIDLIERERVTCLFGVPAMYNNIAQSPRWATADLSSVRNMLCGGAPVPESTIHTYLDKGLSFLQGYGMTETSPGALLLDHDRATSKAGSAGYPHFFTDVRVVRPDFTDVAVAEKGEIVVQGPNVMTGYWQNPSATEAGMTDGWFHTGDVATVDGDGAVYIVDRIKDMIISGGENIYPAEVESALHEHPSIVDCAVIGIPDERWGEVGRAIVVLAEGTTMAEADVVGFLTGRLAKYKIPTSVIVVDALPRNASGKILRSHLRERHTPA